MLYGKNAKAFRRNRIAKTDARRLSDLEDHLYILRYELKNLKQDIAHLKVLSGELRTLLCLSSGTEGLLWRLIRRFDVTDQVRLHVAGSLDPDHPLAKGLRLAVVPIARPNREWEKHIPSRLYSFKNIIQSGEPVYTLGKSYTYEKLIKMVAEQTGVCHEDDGISPGLASIEEVLLNGIPSYFLAFRIITEITLQIGERVLAKGELLKAFHRHRFSPPLSISIHCSLRKSTLGRVPVAAFRSFIAEISVEAFMLPQSFLFLVRKEGMDPFEVTSPFPSDWKEGEDAVFCLTYIHESHRLQALSPGIYGTTIEARELGYVDARDILKPHPNPVCSANLRLKICYVHERLLNPQELTELPEILIEPPTISL